MRLLLEQLEKSLGNELYFLSLFMVLTIPDIAGALDSENGEASGSKYKSWFDKWNEYQISGDACYRFRCSLLHQGSTQHPSSPFERIIFIEPGASTNTIQYAKIDDVLLIDLKYFCEKMISAARKWLDTVEETQRYKVNSEKFIKRYPMGLSPYVGGIPVIG